MRVFPVSTFSPQALPQAAQKLADWVEAHPSLPLGDVAHTLAARRTPSNERLAVTASSHEELAARLRAFADGGDTDTGAVTGRPVLSGEQPGPVLVFTGQGSQWKGMCQGLLDRDAAFTAAIDELEPLIAAEGGFSLRAILTDPDLLCGVDRIQPTLFAVQVALAAVWRSWGVVPAAVVGQSMGEVAAAVVAGRLTVGDGVKVMCRRAGLLRQVSGGAMASVLLDADTVRADLTAQQADGVSLAVYTSSGQVVISGDRAQVEALTGLWQERGDSASLVPVDYASHSPHMDQLTTPITKTLADLKPTAGSARFYTTVAADPCEEVALDGAYWARNLRAPVRFEQAVTSALDDGHRLFIECTAHPLAVRALNDTATAHGITDAVMLGTLHRDTADDEALLHGVAAAHCAGAAIDWTGQYPGVLVDVPTFTWHRTHHRFDPPYELVAPGLVGASQHSLLGGHVHDPDREGRYLWQTPISPARLPWLADHQVAGTPVMAGAGICEMMAYAADHILATDQLALEDLQLDAPLLLDPEPAVSLQGEIAEDGHVHLTVTSRTDTGRITHAKATARVADETPPALPKDVPSPDAWDSLVPADLYAYFRDKHQVIHGPAFQGIERIQVHQQTDRAVARLAIPDVARSSAWMMRIHPALLDSTVQAALAIWCTRYCLDPGPVVVAGCDRVTLHGPKVNQARTAYLNLASADTLSCTANAVLATNDGQVVATIEGLQVANITPPEERFVARLSHLTHTPQPAPGTRSQPGRFLILAEVGTWPQELTAALSAHGIDHRLCHLTDGKLPAPYTGGFLDGSQPTTVIYALSNRSHAPAPTLAQQRVRTLAGLMRHLANVPGCSPRLWVTACAGHDSLTTAGLRGLLRTAVYEYPALTVSLIEADPAAGAKGVAAELLCDDPRPREVYLTAGARLIAQVTATPPEPHGLPAEIRADGAYLITGALGGLGLLTVTDLARHSAGHIIALGRGAPTEQAAALLDELRTNGAHITLIRGDIADPATVTAALDAVAVLNVPLRGVFHAAGVIEDAVLDNLTPDLLDRVWRGKAHGAWQLHEATKHLDLDFWVVYSSLAGLLGSPGQAAYAAANAFLDDLTAHRRALGLPGTSIQWGAWSETGRGQGMAERGFVMISPTDGVDALNRILAAGHTHVAYSPIDLDQWLAPYPHAAASALFATHSVATTDTDTTLLNDLQEADDDNRRHTLLNAHIIDLLRDILTIPDQHITPTTSMVMLGLDSLNAMRLRQQLQRTLHMDINIAVLWTKPTPAGIADWILTQMGYAP
ncbi:SDR family NAD(P)-dependent oxidoreductase (plasmid) [Streptomyces sp. JCM17656]|nr:SDR family NAD(P)-dependent oxidoreductase [Streptomyces sp. JCM17656]